MATLLKGAGTYITERPDWMPPGADEGGRLFLPHGAEDPLWLPEGAIYDPTHPDNFILFCEHLLTWPSGFKAGQPVIWDAWQLDRMARPLLGAVWEDSGRLLTTTMFFLAARGNAKTTFGSAIALFGLTAMGEPNATVDLFAVSREQAERLWWACERFVRQSDPLCEKLSVHDSRKRITYDDTGAQLVTRTGDAKAELGLNSFIAIVDELLAQKSKALWETIDGSKGKRPQQMLLSLTTPSPEVESFARDEYNRAKRVSEKRNLEPTYLPVIFECDPDDDPFLEANWHKANPALNGGWLSLDVIREKANAAKLDPHKLHEFKVFRMALWADSGDGGFVTLTAWDEGASEPPTDLNDYPCYGGLDVSASSDVTSWCMAWQLEPGVMYAQWRHWITEEMYRDLIEWTQGHMRTWREHPDFKDAVDLTVHDGKVIDLKEVVATVIADCQHYGVWSLGIDSMRSFEVRRLIDEYASDLPVQLLDQRARSMHAALERTGDLANRGRMLHTGDPFARWMFGNASVKIIDGYPKLIKDYTTERRKRIDAPAALCMAVDRRLAWEKEVSDDEQFNPMAWSLSELARGDTDSEDDDSEEDLDADDDWAWAEDDIDW